MDERYACPTANTHNYRKRNSYGNQMVGDLLISSTQFLKYIWFVNKYGFRISYSWRRFGNTWITLNWAVVTNMSMPICSLPFHAQPCTTIFTLSWILPIVPLIMASLTRTHEHLHPFVSHPSLRYSTYSTTTFTFPMEASPYHFLHVFQCYFETSTPKEQL